MRKATIITDEPVIEVIADMRLNEPGVMAMAKWVASNRPETVPDGGFNSPSDLFPHDGTEPFSDELMQPDGPVQIAGRRTVTDNELLVEIAGRKCYDSWGTKAAKRTNGQYIASMISGRDVPHRSVAYHAKTTFFFANVSRRFSHEFIRNYVGSDRNEEGSPSQESTRYTEHPGVYICHPHDILGPVRPQRVGPGMDRDLFEAFAQKNYDHYQTYIEAQIQYHKSYNDGAEPKGMDRKRIYEAASGYLLQSVATSFIWTTNPIALAKFRHERDNEASDLEMQRFANKLGRVCDVWWPNLFPEFKK